MTAFKKKKEIRVILHCVNVPYFFIYSFVEGYPGGIQFLAMMETATMIVIKTFLLIRWNNFWIYAIEWYTWVLSSVDSQLSEKHSIDFHSYYKSLQSNHQWRSFPLASHHHRRELLLALMVLAFLTSVR